MAELGTAAAAAALATSEQPGPAAAQAVAAAGGTSDEVLAAVKDSGVTDDIEADMVTAAAISVHNKEDEETTIAAIMAAGGDHEEAEAAAKEAIEVARQAGVIEPMTHKTVTLQQPTMIPTTTHTFALTPASAVEGVVDFNTKIGSRVYSLGTNRLDPEELFDCVPEDMYPFLKMMSERAIEMGWSNMRTGITQIPRPGQTHHESPSTDNLLTNYGEIPMTRIRAFEETYIDRPCRSAQDSYMLFKCVWNSLSKTGKNKVQIWEHQYKVGPYYSGNLILKVVIRESHLDSNATSTSIRESLASLDTYIQTVQCDIVKFNGHVKLLVDSLAARGETTSDLLVNIFKAYSNVSDKTFVSYMARKKESHEEGNTLTSDEIMNLGANKYKQLKTLNIWNAPSPEEEKIMALEAKVDKMKANNKRNSKGKRSGRDDKGKRHPRKGQKKEGKHRAKSSGLPTAKPTPEQKALPPKPLIHKGKKWWWCCKETGGKCDGIWRIHTPSACKGKAAKQAMTMEVDKLAAETAEMEVTDNGDGYES